MKNIKKYLSLFLLVIFWLQFLFVNISQAKILCWTVKWYALFKCRVDDICKKYYDWPKKTPENFDELLEKKDTIYDSTTLRRADAVWKQVYRAIPYLKAEEYYKEKIVIGSGAYSDIPFDVATQTYKNNMNWIYSCAILYTQLKVLKEVKELLKEDNSWEIRKKYAKTLDEKIKKIEDFLSKQSDSKLEGQCRNLKVKKLFKRDVLREVTYETCKFRVYMEYLKWYYSENIKNLFKQKPDKDWKEVDTPTLQWSDFANAEYEILAKIDNQIRHSYLVFDKAFKEYSSYEWNYYIHEMLNFLKMNFIVLRIKLHNVLTPMNQVVYKISNAMKKQ